MCLSLVFTRSVSIDWATYFRRRLQLRRCWTVLTTAIPWPWNVTNSALPSDHQARKRPVGLSPTFPPAYRLLQLHLSGFPFRSPSPVIREALCDLLKARGRHDHLLPL